MNILMNLVNVKNKNISYLNLLCKEELFVYMVAIIILLSLNQVV